jgi:transcriptional regulator with XRE-family HTH domain
VPTGDAARALAVRLRALRKSQWPDVSITQAQLAEALEQRKPTSVQLISSWERTSNPTPPPEDRLNAIATFFSTRRSFEGGRFRLINETDLTESEAEDREKLHQELHGLRQAALAGSGTPWAVAERPAPTIVGRGPWHFEDDGPVIIVCAELPDDVQQTMPGSALPAPDRAELSRFADLDSLFELHGHIRAVNPDREVQYRSAARMRRDDWTAHLVLLGGVDWNKATQDTMRLTGVPLRQYSDDADPSRGCFRVVGNGDEQSFAPEFEDRGTGRVLVQDVGHFLRAPNPLNRTRTVTVCNGMYGSGVFGSVRTLTDKVFRERNADYLAETFDGNDTFSLLFRVQIGNGVVVTPDWTAPDTVLHTWSEAAS